MLVFLFAGCAGKQRAKLVFTEPPNPFLIGERLASQRDNAVSFAARGSGSFRSPDLSGDVTVNLYFDSLTVTAAQFKSIIGTMIIVGSDEDKIWYRSYQGDDRACWIYPRNLIGKCSVSTGLRGIKPELILGFIEPELIYGAELVYRNESWYFVVGDYKSAAHYTFDPQTNLPYRTEFYSFGKRTLLIETYSYQMLSEGFAVPKSIFISSDTEKIELKLDIDKLKQFEFTDKMKEKFFLPPQSESVVHLTDDCTYQNQ